MTDEAQEVAAVATATGKAFDIVRAVGSYTADVLQTVPHDLVGFFGGDALKSRRARNIARLAGEAQADLDPIAAERKSPPSASVVLPLLAAAADEERDELRALWAALLANTAIDGGRKVRREFFETIHDMEPDDARVFQVIARLFNGQLRLGTDFRRELEDALREVDLVLAEAEVSLGWLTLRNCIVYPPENNSSLTPYGRALMKALTVD